MEEKKKEELKSLLEGLQKALEMYNDLNPQEKLTITPQEEKKDVSDIFICVYNNKHVGLFKKINWDSNYSYRSGDDYYDAGSIYVGVDSNYVGMKQTHERWIDVSYWKKAGARVALKDKDTYVANCNMENGMSFDDMRLIMYGDGQIGPYEIGKASSQEMIDVLKYASSYYQLDKNIQMQRVK